MLNKSLHDFCPSFKVIYVYELKDEERGKPCGTYDEKRDTYLVLVGKHEGRRQLERPRRRWKNNIKTNHPERVSEVLTKNNWAEDRQSWLAVLNTVMNLLFHAVPVYLDWLRK